ncbi:sporulation integral membrane protein YtvI [Salipaludibacillus daqingensis]|uniref:sporulation integral membrane protein YtvI n=1 Tax=Salipaludibacillus daqingensis TaxID=3041001 RepID=UPI002476C3CE|nr:sporulation integral membrane protein YtvI [Salipaludibacillus daqingensis]
MINHSSTTWKQVVFLLLIISGILILSFVSLIYFYPFLLAFIFSLIFLPFVNFLDYQWRWNRSLASLIVIGSFIIILLTFFSFLIAEIVQGLSYLVKVLPSNMEDILFNIQHILDQTIFPFINNIAQFSSNTDNSSMNMDQTMEELISQTGFQIVHLLQLTLNQLRDFFMAIPHAMTMIFFSLLASFFMTKDWPQIITWLHRYVPIRLFQFTSRMMTEWKTAFGNYIKAQLTLVFITGIIVFVGLLILRVEYAFTTALLIAMVDILPYIGTGAVFLPWIIYAFFQSNWYMTIGLSILYSLVVLQRQVSEPRIVAHHIGTPTLIFLFTIFACYQFFGFIGILFGPLVLILSQSLARAGIVEEIKIFLAK